MTYNELYRHIISVLKKAGIDSPAFDALCIFESKLGLTRHDLIMTGSKEAAKERCDAVTELAEKRAEGYPLQYLLGMWQFMDSDFFLGEGVLIPREDTSVVVQLCLDNIKNLYGTDNLSVIDLCAGSGAISISLAKALPNSRVTALELSDKAIYYLQKNIQHNGCGNVEAVKGNVFTDFNITDAAYDVIISNPPYIISSEIKTLQREVQYEPAMALDGGSDGYDFYRAIISKWSNKLKSGGLLVFELGENQYDAVSHLMYRQGYKDITFATDLGDVKRGICGVKI